MRLLLRARDGARAAVTGLPLPVAVIYVVSTLFNLLAFNQGDLNHTVASSYAYLFGHGLDFYDYNATVLGGNDYFPTTYILFAIWMAPVKFIVSPGIQHGMDLSSIEVAWAKLLLLLFFWATFYVVSKIAKQLFPDRERTQTTVRIAFLLSPLAAFVFNCFGQYDIIGVFFTAVGFLFYLKGDKWRFAIFFALAASSKYFALLIFVPLVLIQFKKLRDIILLGLVTVSILAIEALIYLPNAAFRHHTLFSLVGGKVAGAGLQPITVFVAIIFLVGCIVLWRVVPTPKTLGPLAVFSIIVTYGLMFTAVVWHPQWFILLTPFFAIALGYLKRPTLFLIWDSVFFLVYIWLVGNAWVQNVDTTMVQLGSLNSFLPDPLLLLSDFYPAWLVPVLRIVLAFYVFSPLAFFLIERARAPRPLDEDGRRTSTWVWLLRALTLPLVFTLPVIVALTVPVSTAERINPRASTIGLRPVSECTTIDTPYGEIRDGRPLEQTFVAAEADLAAVSFKAATYARPTAGSLDLRILDTDGVVQAEKTLDLAGLHDNADLYFVFPALEDSAGKTYTLELSTTDTAKGKGIAVWGSGVDCSPAGTLEIADEVQTGDAVVTSYYDER